MYTDHVLNMCRAVFKAKHFISDSLSTGLHIIFLTGPNWDSVCDKSLYLREVGPVKYT